MVYYLPNCGRRLCVKQNPPRLQLIPFFLFVECVIYVLFLTLDLLDHFELSLWVKYSGSLFCAAFSLTGRDRITQAALALTAIADWFLHIQNTHWLFGIFLFLCVQSLYQLRLHREGCPGDIRLRIGLTAALMALLFPLNMVTPLNLLAMLYFSQLIANIILAWSFSSAGLFAWGLTLLSGCDLCVGLLHAPLLPPSFCAVAGFGIWLFYLPSLVLIALSALSPKEAFYENK